jgi:hypothetical protein
MLTRIEARCAKCGEDLLVGPGEYMRDFLGKKGMDRICKDCKEQTVKTVTELASEFSQKFDCLTESHRADLRIAFYAGYEQGIAAAQRIIRETRVCPDCKGMSGTVTNANGTVVHFCNCEEPT